MSTTTYAETYQAEVRAWAELEAITGRGSARHTLDGKRVGEATDQLDVLADRAAEMGAELAHRVTALASVQVPSDRERARLRGARARAQQRRQEAARTLAQTHGPAEGSEPA